LANSSLLSSGCDGIPKMSQTSSTVSENAMGMDEHEVL
jgi:hypothetical protein